MKKIILTISCLILSGNVLASDNTVNVGVVLPLSGQTSNYGIEALKGINLAVEEINENGGVKDRHLNLIIRDNAGAPTKTSLEVTSLIQEESIIAVIGPITSTNATAAAAVAQQYKTPLILPIATSPYVTEIGEYICRICFTDPLQSKALAEFSKQNLKSEKVAIIFEKNSSYSEKLSEFFSLRFQDMGGKIVFMESFKHNSNNLTSLVDDALKQNPDILFLPVYYPEAAAIFNYIDKIGSSVVMLGGDGWDSTELFRLTNHKIKSGQVYLSSHFSLQLQEQQGSSFVEKFQQTFGHSANAVSALGFDAVKVLADAMNRATIFSKDGIQQAIVSTNNFQGVTGRISINEKRNVIKDIYILQALKDSFIYNTIISSF